MFNLDIRPLPQKIYDLSKTEVREANSSLTVVFKSNCILKMSRVMDRSSDRRE